MKLSPLSHELPDLAPQMPNPELLLQPADFDPEVAAAIAELEPEWEEVVDPEVDADIKTQLEYSNFTGAFRSDKIVLPNATFALLPAREAQPASREQVPGWKKKFAAVVGLVAAIGAGVSYNAEPASADSGHHKVINGYDLAKLSPSKIYQKCMDEIRVVAHEGTTSKGKIDVDTPEYLQHAKREGHNIVELDLQINKEGFIFSLHNQGTNDEETRNGHGDAYKMSEKEIRNLRTTHGSRLLTLPDVIKFLQDNPGMSIQGELKVYGDQWSPKQMQGLYDRLKEADVLDQWKMSSGGQAQVHWFTDNAPEIEERQVIGLENYLPNLKNAKKAGATQVNITTEAALKHPQYTPDAHKLGLAISWRSETNGKYDVGTVWLRGILYHVRQFVVNKEGATKTYVCRAAEQAARTS